MSASQYAETNNTATKPRLPVMMVQFRGEMLRGDLLIREGTHWRQESSMLASWGWFSRCRMPQIDTRIAADFLTRCFAPAETVALFLRRKNPAATTQRIVTLETVLAMLEFRRRFEIPAELCSVRAREIAATALRMIGRRKLA